MDIHFDPVDWITAAAIGEPGDRTFYVQAAQDGEIVSILCEKAQVRAISESAQDALQSVGVTVTPDDVDSSLTLREPIKALFRAGRIGLGSNAAGTIFELSLEEIGETNTPEDEDLTVARFVMSREQMVAFSAFAMNAVEQGGRKQCPLCPRLMDPLVGCVGCPGTNGSGPKH